MSHGPACYNEYEPYCAAWLGNLKEAGHIAQGFVDSRSVVDLRAADLSGFRQVHLFAGLGGWSHALRLAGVPDDFPVWTASLPCQPFSVAGKGAGFDDDRHLWPVVRDLIEQCRPAIIFGEQVSSNDGAAWLDVVFTDLEALVYACGALAAPSAGAGAPHLRERTYWMAYATGARLEGRPAGRQRPDAQQPAAERSGSAGGVAHADRQAWGCPPGPTVTEAGYAPPEFGAPESGRHGSYHLPGGLADPYGWNPGAEREQRGGQHGQQPSHGVPGFWDAADWLPCRDGKSRPVEPGSFPLAHGVPNRVGRLRAYGNAINPHQAAEFIRAGLGACAALGA